MYMHTRTYVHASLFVNVLYTSLYVIMYMNVCVYTHSCVRSERYILGGVTLFLHPPSLQFHEEVQLS